MSRTLLLGVAALALTGLAPSKALAITHGCTDPPDIKSLTIKLDLDGKSSSASGPYCAAIKQAVAMIDRSAMSKEGKQAAKKALGDLQAKGPGSPTAGKVNWWLQAQCQQGGGCGGSFGISGSF
jgi:hypothetical protein